MAPSYVVHYFLIPKRCFLGFWPASVSRYSSWSFYSYYKSRHLSETILTWATNALGSYSPQPRLCKVNVFSRMSIQIRRYLVCFSLPEWPVRWSAFSCIEPTPVIAALKYARIWIVHQSTATYPWPHTPPTSTANNCQELFHQGWSLSSSSPPHAGMLIMCRSSTDR